MTKPKVPTKVIHSDTCTVTIDGTEYAIHEGEWVEIIPIIEVRETQAFSQLGQFQIELEAARDDATQGQIADIMNRHYDVICEGIASKVVAWNWTNMLGVPLPQPDGSTELFKRLTADELYWLFAAIRRQEAPESRKNDSAATLTSSSDSVPAPTPMKSSSGRNRTKAS